MKTWLWTSGDLVLVDTLASCLLGVFFCMPMTLPYCQHNVLVCKRWVTSVLMSVRCGTFLLLHRKAIYNVWWKEPNEPDTPLNYGQTKWNTSVILFIVNQVCQICRICFVNIAASSIIIISSVIGKGQATMSWWSCIFWLFYCLPHSLLWLWSMVAVYLKRA